MKEKMNGKITIWEDLTAEEVELFCQIKTSRFTLITIKGEGSIKIAGHGPTIAAIRKAISSIQSLTNM